MKIYSNLFLSFLKLKVISVLQELNNALKLNDSNKVKQCITNPKLQLEYSVKTKDLQYAYELLLVYFILNSCIFTVNAHNFMNNLIYTFRTDLMIQKTE